MKTKYCLIFSHHEQHTGRGRHIHFLSHKHTHRHTQSVNLTLSFMLIDKMDKCQL